MGERRQRATFREHLASPAQKLVAVAAGITTLIGVPLAINALIETFLRDDSPAAPHSAMLSVGPPEDIGITWGEYLEDHRDEVSRQECSRSSPGRQPARCGVFGLVLPVEVDGTGLAGKAATLRWTVENPSGATNTGKYEPPSWVPRSREIRFSHSPQHRIAYVWVPPTSGPIDEQIVQFTFIDDRGDELDRAKSEVLEIEPN